MNKKDREELKREIVSVAFSKPDRQPCDVIKQASYVLAVFVGNIPAQLLAELSDYFCNKELHRESYRAFIDELVDEYFSRPKISSKDESMTAGELMEILDMYDPEEVVTMTFWNGEGAEISDVDCVCDNAGPSIYADDWKGEKMIMNEKVENVEDNELYKKGYGTGFSNGHDVGFSEGNDMSYSLGYEAAKDELTFQYD